MRFNLYPIMAAGFLALGLTACQAAPTNGVLTEKPNILLIMADDLGYNDLGIQASPEMLTPHIDSLAKNGVRFTDAHVNATVCSPSRAGMITGRYQQRFGHECNCPPLKFGMNLEEQTLGDLLKGQGYRTGIFGKWHLGDNDKYHPNNRGFDTFVGFREGSRSYWPNPKTDRKGNPHAIERNMEQIQWKGYLTDFLGEECIRFMNQESDKPFFAYMSYNAPHGPMHAKPEHLERFKDSPRPKLRGMIYALDLSIGKLIENLKKNGKYENTLIYFLSDNGGTPNSNGCNWPLNGYKGNKFEGGHRVPFFIQWPAKIKPGQVCDGLISSLDIAATSLIAAGGKLPSVRPLDGVDLMPYMTGKKNGHPHAELYWRKENNSAIRMGNWKLIGVKPYGQALYNLKDDPRERNNLIRSKPEVAAELNAQFKQWEKDMVTPGWSEGEFWDKKTREIHIEYIENRSTRMDKVHKALGIDRDGNFTQRTTDQP